MLIQPNVDTIQILLYSQWTKHSLFRNLPPLFILCILSPTLDAVSDMDSVTGQPGLDDWVLTKDAD